MIRKGKVKGSEEALSIVADYPPKVWNISKNPMINRKKSYCRLDSKKYLLNRIIMRSKIRLKLTGLIIKVMLMLIRKDTLNRTEEAHLFIRRKMTNHKKLFPICLDIIDNEIQISFYFIFNVYLG